MSAPVHCRLCRLDEILATEHDEQKLLALLREGGSVGSHLEHLSTLHDHRDHCIKAENDRLKSQIHVLNDRNADLKREVSRMEQLLVDATEKERVMSDMVATVRSRRFSHLHLFTFLQLEYQIQKAKGPRSPCRNMHIEGLRHIFEHLLPVAGFLEDTIHAGPRGHWFRLIRTLKSVALVCKAWHAAAFPLLYYNVVITRVGQVVSFAKTIRGSPETFGPLVRSLTLRCEVPPECFSGTQQSLADVFRRCTQLKSISFRAFFPFLLLRESETGPDSTVSGVRLPSHVTSLGLYDDILCDNLRFGHPPVRSTVPFPSSPNGIVSLSINEFGMYNTRMDFLQLEILTVRLSKPGDASRTYLVPPEWSMPKLHAFRVGAGHQIYGFEGGFQSFIEEYGPQLKNLDITPVFVTPAIARAIGLCSHLEHLVIRQKVGMSPSQYVLPNQYTFFHQPLKLVDIIIPSAPGTQVKRLRRSLTIHHGSKWEAVRYVDKRILSWAPNALYSESGLLNDFGQGEHDIDIYGLQIHVWRPLFYLRDVLLHDDRFSISSQDIEDEADNLSSGDDSYGDLDAESNFLPSSPTSEYHYGDEESTEQSDYSDADSDSDSDSAYRATVPINSVYSSSDEEDLEMSELDDLQTSQLPLASPQIPSQQLTEDEISDIFSNNI